MIFPKKKMHVHTVYLYKDFLRSIHIQIQIQKFTSAFIWYNRVKKKKKKNLWSPQSFFIVSCQDPSKTKLTK